MQVQFQNMIHDFNLAICLRMVSFTQSQMCPTIVEKLSPEQNDEDRIPIKDDAPRKPLEFTDNVHEQGHDLEGRVSSGQCAKVDTLGETIHGYQDYGESVRTWKVGNEIKGKIFPNTYWYW